MADIYGGFDFLAAGNALSQMQSGRIAQENARLQQQYTMEDRAREAENRKIAAGNALAARAKAAKIAGVYEQGFNPGQTALMTPGIAPGPGVVRKAVEPSYDYTKTALQFLKMGETGKAEELFKLPEARREASAKGMEGDAKAQLAVLETSAKAYATALANVKPVLDQAISIDGLLHYVDVVDKDEILGPLALKTGGPTEARKEAIRKMAAPKEAGGGGMTVDQIAKRLSGVSGYDLAGFDLDAKAKQATIDQTNAAAAKARSEASGGGSGASVEERNRALFAKAMQDPNYPATAEYAALYNMSFGRKMVEVQDPNGPPGQMVNRIIDVPAPEGFPRPTFVQQQNALAPATAAAQPTNALAMVGRYGSGAPAPMAAPPNLSVDMRTGENMVTKQPAPSSARETQTITEENKKAGAKAALDFIGFDPATGKTSVDKLLPTSTSGSMEQLGADFFATFGASTEGSKAIAQLETIASTLALELAGGKLGAGFSNEDRRFLLTTLGDVSNSVKPVQDRLAAWKTAKRYMAQKAGVTLPEDHAENATPKETTETYATAKTLVDKINASNMSQERKTELINKVYEKLTISGYDPAKVK